MAKKKLSMKPHKTKAKSRVRGGKAGPSKPGNRAVSKGMPKGSSGPGLAHEGYMTP